MGDAIERRAPSASRRAPRCRWTPSGRAAWARRSRPGRWEGRVSRWRISRVSQAQSWHTPQRKATRALRRQCALGTPVGLANGHALRAIMIFAAFRDAGDRSCALRRATVARFSSMISCPARHSRMSDRRMSEITKNDPANAAMNHAAAAPVPQGRAAKPRAPQSPQSPQSRRHQVPSITRIA